MTTTDSVLTRSHLGSLRPLRPHIETAIHGEAQKDTATAGHNEELREAFTQFVGQAFFGQMIKAMRSTVGEPAYFHGGQGEEVFQSQLDQTLAEYMTEASAEQFADPMFERQFPHLAAVKEPHHSMNHSSGLNQLNNLPRR